MKEKAHHFGNININKAKKRQNNVRNRNKI